MFQEEDAIGNGSIFNAVTKDEICNIKLVWPSPTLEPLSALISAFEEQVQPIFSILESLYKANANLRRTRDKLLPRLISGEIDVSSWVEDGEEGEMREAVAVAAQRAGVARKTEPVEALDVAAVERPSLWE